MAYSNMVVFPEYEMNAKGLGIPVNAGGGDGGRRHEFFEAKTFFYASLVARFNADPEMEREYEL